METGLNSAISDGRVSEFPSKKNYFIAGALKESDVDFVFNNVGHSSTAGLHSLPISDEVRKRAEKALAERTAEDRETSGAIVSTAQQEEEAAEDAAEAAAAPSKPGRTRPELNYRNFAKLFPEITGGEYRYLRMEADGAMMPLNLDWIDTDIIAISHTYTQNGDLMRDPEMTFRVNREKGTLEALTFQQDGGIPIYQEVYPEPGKWIPNLRRDLNNFAAQWMKNIKEQGFTKKRAVAERNGEDVEVFFSPEGAPFSAYDILMREADAITANLLRDETYANARMNSDKQNSRDECFAAISRIVVSMAETNSQFYNIYSDAPAAAQRFRDYLFEATYQQHLTEELDASPEPDNPTVVGASDQPPHDPLAPAYYPGDTVYLENKAYEITGVGLLDVELTEASHSIPFLRSMDKLAFEQRLRLDPRNSRITLYLPADLGRVNDDLRDVLVNHLLTDRDKGYISGWIRSGENNRGVSMRLSDAFASHAETVTLHTGEKADYFTSTVSMEVNILNDQNEKVAAIHASWEEAAATFRALWLQELDGFTHAPVHRKPVTLEGRLSYQVGDKVFFDGGDHDVSGTIEYIGDLDVRIDTGPYAWSHETVSRDFFENALRHDERNASLFTPEPPEVEVTPEATTIYPADNNNLPYDVVVERLHVNEPEHSQPEPSPGPGNFRITDDHLGEGGPKEKFRRNMEAITLLHELEFDGRQATPEEQEILSRYVGWGALADAFDETKSAWANEFKELYAVLSPEEYAAARASTLNSHYTSPTVIKAVYEAIGNMGFKAGNILEPSCGVGNFFGLLPEEMSASKLYGVELDSVTGRIARQLYPKANIQVQGFENTDFPKDFFDLAIGNVPFGQYSVNDREYNKLNFSIHNYFFAKTLDQVRPGGIVAFVTSRYTLDARDSTVRRYLAQRGDLLGAIRLPNNAFKANAGTEVVSDIIFLQKRDTPSRDEPAWVQTGENQDGFTINRYFLDHPEMILGRPSAESTQYSRQDFTVEPIEGVMLADQLHDAVKHISGQYREAETPDLGEDALVRNTIPADPDVKNYSYTVVDGKVYYRENSIMSEPYMTVTARGRVMAMVELRDCVRDLIDLQMDEYTPDSRIAEKQLELNQLYDAFSAKYGLINDRANRLAFSADSAYYLLCALEVVDENGKLERKADMFTKRTIKPHREITSVDTASEALAVSLGEKGRVDMPYMAQLTGKTEEELEADLTGVLYRDIRCAENPEDIPRAFANLNRFPFVTADEYLSGNVRKKLRMAQAMYAVLPDEMKARARQNVDALEAAQPKDLDASEIEVRLGATWIDKRYIQQFMYETLDTPWNLQKVIKVNYSPLTAEWQITGKNSAPYHDVAAYTTYGTNRANAYRILEDSLNLRDVRIYDTVEDADGREKRVLNGQETTLAAQKQQALREAFKDWIWKDPQRRQTLVKQYNEEMNSTRPREYDGRHIVFPGMNPEIKLKEHQLNAIAHILYGGNTLLAHEVGAGKTFEMVAAAMESKRLGLCHKSIIVVPNHLIEQWAAEFLRLYPSANILVTTKRDFEPHNRKKFCARIATGDYDAVIIGHSQFERIPISLERQAKQIREQIKEVEAGIKEIMYGGGEHVTIKRLERTKKGLEARLKKLQANHRKDNVISFEELGVDRMFVDESDAYKNLFFYTKMRNVAGLSTSDAQRSSDMFAKCRYLDELTGGRGVVFATGTPKYTPYIC